VYFSSIGIINLENFLVAIAKGRVPVSDQSTLSDFERKSTSQTESFECEICGRSFDSNKGRGIHRAKSHTEEEIKQVLITELHNLAVELNKTPSQRDMDLQGAHSSKTYQKKFGSWNEALKEADLAINKEQSISKPDLIDELVCLSDELERTPTSRDMAKDGKYAPSSYSNEFGSWNNAVREAGLEPTRYRNVPRQELICELERLTEELGHTPTAPEMTQHGSFTNKTYSREFGSWNNALEKAGLGINREKDVPESDLLNELHRLREELGQTPSAVDMDKEGKFSVGTYERRFGSWNEALEQSDLDINNRSNIPDFELITELQRLADELGRTPRAVDMTAQGKFGWKTYKTTFGSWGKALNEADLEHRQILHPLQLDHLCRSGYEVEVAKLLLDAGVEYDYESMKIEYGENRNYTPDFVTDEYIIEVKGHVYRDEKKLAEIALDNLDKKQYVVVGEKLPCDIHIPWEERTRIQKLFE
jgi:hypothetical protein